MTIIGIIDLEGEFRLTQRQPVIRNDQLQKMPACNATQVTQQARSPCDHPADHVRLREETADCIALNLTLRKLHFATFMRFSGIFFSEGA